MQAWHQPGTVLGTGLRSPPPPLRAPAGDPTPITLVKGTWVKSRVAIETQELRLSTRKCDFPGINIPKAYPGYPRKDAVRQVFFVPSTILGTVHIEICQNC